MPKDYCTLWWAEPECYYIHTYIHKSFIKTMTERIDFTVKTV